MPCVRACVRALAELALFEARARRRYIRKVRVVCTSEYVLVRHIYVRVLYDTYKRPRKFWRSDRSADRKGSDHNDRHLSSLK